MKLNKSIIVVTGGASGIGKALVRQFSSEGATVIIADLNLESAVELAKEVGGFGVFCDVRIEKSIIDLVKVVTDKFNKIDIFCSNAGVLFEELGDATSTRNVDWQSSWEVNVMAHVYAARACLPCMIRSPERIFFANYFCSWIIESNWKFSLFNVKTCSFRICGVFVYYPR